MITNIRRKTSELLIVRTDHDPSTECKLRGIGRVFECHVVGASRVGIDLVSVLPRGIANRFASYGDTREIPATKVEYSHCSVRITQQSVLQLGSNACRVGTNRHVLHAICPSVFAVLIDLPSVEDDRYVQFLVTCRILIIFDLLVDGKKYL